MLLCVKQTGYVFFCLSECYCASNKLGMFFCLSECYCASNKLGMFSNLSWMFFFVCVKQTGYVSNLSWMLLGATTNWVCFQLVFWSICQSLIAPYCATGPSPFSTTAALTLPQFPILTCTPNPTSLGWGAQLWSWTWQYCLVLALSLTQDCVLHNHSDIQKRWSRYAQ